MNYKEANQLICAMGWKSTRAYKTDSNGNLGDCIHYVVDADGSEVGSGESLEDACTAALEWAARKK